MKFTVKKVFLASLFSATFLSASDTDLQPADSMSHDRQQAHEVLDTILDAGEEVIKAVQKQYDAASAYNFIFEHGRLKLATQWKGDDSGQNIPTATISEAFTISDLDSSDPLHAFVARWNSLNDGMPTVYEVRARPGISKWRKKTEYSGTYWFVKPAQITETAMDSQTPVTAVYSALLLYNPRVLHSSSHEAEIGPRRMNVFLQTVKEAYPDMAIYKQGS